MRTNVSSAVALLTAHDLRKHYRGREVLSGVSLRIMPRELVTIIGPNGAGKTTLLKQLIGLERPDSGTITRMEGLTIGYIPQQFRPPLSMPITVRDFLKLTQANGIEEACGDVGVAYTLNQPLSALSGGEMRRVLLARSILRKPHLLVLDEPTAGVDVAGQGELYQLIAKLSNTHGCAVLMVSHDLYVVMAQTTRVICLNGHVCCEGTPQVLGATPAFKELFGDNLAKQLAMYHHHHDHTHNLHEHADHSECRHP
jgi:zinc transport system ATP-binding protein